MSTSALDNLICGYCRAPIVDHDRMALKICNHRLAEQVANARADAIGEARDDAAQSCQRYAEMISSQNDITGQTENWSDFYRGQHYAALQLADAFRSAALEQLKKEESSSPIIGNAGLNSKCSE